MTYWHVVLAVAAVAALALVTVGRAERGAKVLLAHDMEGLAAATASGDYNTSSPNYAKTRQGLTDEVNAAIRGLLKAGASEVVLTDCHASGNTENPDYLIDQLPKGARFDMRSAAFDPYTDAIDKSYDALAMVGMHGRSGSKGFSPHTYFGMIRWHFNGLEMSETSMVALSAARFGIPLILVTGDDVHRAEVAEFSKAEYVVVKRALSPQQAEARPQAEALADIEAAAERGLRNAKQIPPYKFPAHLVSFFKFPMAEYTAIASNFPNTTIVDDRTLSLKTDSYLDALVAYRSLSNFMRYATADVIVKALNQMPGGADLVKQARSKLPPRNYESTARTLFVDNKLDRWGYQ